MRRYINSRFNFLQNFIPGRFTLTPNQSVDQDGHTLVELLIVAVLIGIITVIAAPHLKVLMDNYTLSGATQTVWGDLQNAKLTAAKNNQSVTVTFNSSTVYSFPRGDGSTFVRNLSDEYHGITVSKTGGGSISFGSMGMTQNASVVIQGARGSKTIHLTWTGRMTIN